MQKYDIIILAGQSNAVGFGCGDSEYKLKYLDHIVQLYDDQPCCYQQDENGNEIFSNYATIGSAAQDNGGLIWDSLGIVWDSLGATWEAGGGSTVTTVTNNSIANVAPTITITGLAENPSFTNLTTNQTLNYGGNITTTQTLVIDVAKKTAKLNGANVTQLVTGDWPTLAPGNNRLTYTTDNPTAPDATIEWQEVVG